MGVNDQTAARTVDGIKLATSQQELLAGRADERAELILNTLLKDTDAQQLLGVNRFNNILWFNKEGFDQLLFWMQQLAAIPMDSVKHEANAAIIEARTRTIAQLRQAMELAEYQVEKLRAAVVKSSRVTASSASTSPKAALPGTKKSD